MRKWRVTQETVSPVQPFFSFPHTIRRVLCLQMFPFYLPFVAIWTFWDLRVGRLVASQFPGRSSLLMFLSTYPFPSATQLLHHSSRFHYLTADRVWRFSAWHLSRTDLALFADETGVFVMVEAALVLLLVQVRHYLCRCTSQSLNRLPFSDAVYFCASDHVHYFFHYLLFDRSSCFYVIQVATGENASIKKVHA